MLGTAKKSVTNIYTSAHTAIQYLQQHTEEMDLLCSPDATHRRETELQVWKERKERHRRGRDRG